MFGCFLTAGLVSHQLFWFQSLSPTCLENWIAFNGFLGRFGRARFGHDMFSCLASWPSRVRHECLHKWKHASFFMTGNSSLLRMCVCVCVWVFVCCSSFLFFFLGNNPPQRRLTVLSPVDLSNESRVHMQAEDMPFIQAFLEPCLFCMIRS